MQRPLVDHNANVSTRAISDEAKAPAQVLGAANQLTYYPAYTFKASATWSKWVKLTCHDIHTVLKPHEKYSNSTTFTDSARHEKPTNHRRNDTPLLLFYFNHPIQFVQVIGVVVALEDYFEKFWLFTVDDSSGATIDVTCPKPEKEEKDPKVLRPGSESASKKPGKSHEQDEEPSKSQLLQTTLSRLRIGTTIQAKGTLTTFRKTRQLTLLRLSILPSTTHEMALLSSRLKFYSSTLSKPWVLSREEQRKLRMEAQGERDEEVEMARKRRKREQKKREREVRHRKVIEHEYERDEEERKMAAEEARRWGEKLKKTFSQEEPDCEEGWITAG